MSSNSILNWNCNGFYSHYEDFQILLNTYDPIIFALQETNLRSTNSLSLKNYIIYRKEIDDAIRAHGGVVLAVKNTTFHTEIRLTTHLQALAISCNFGSGLKISICCLYLPPNFAVTKQDIQAIIDQLPTPFLIVGDLNSHNPLWGGSYSNNKGKIIQEILEENDLSIFNTKEHTHLSASHNSWSTIDLLFGTANLTPIINTFHHFDMSGSDHVPQLINLDMRDSSDNDPPDRWNFKNANWQLFQELCSQIPDFDYNQNIDSLISSFTNHILDFASQSIPKCGVFRKKSVPWWSADCQLAIRNRRRALKALKRSPSHFNLINYRKLKAIAQRTIKQAKRDSWKKFISNINSTVSSAHIWSAIRRIESKKSSSSPKSILINDDINTDPTAIANAFADQLSDISNSTNPQQFQISDILPIENSDSDFNQDITLRELEDAINSSKSSAPGPDHVHVEFLQNSPDNIKEILLKIFNIIWNSHLFPKIWRKAIVIPFLKPDKNPFHIDSYRPISLTSNLCKIFERIVNKRLLWFLEQNNKLSPTQCGFRPGRSTLHQLIHLNSKINEAYHNKYHFLAIFFDVCKAFDTISRLKILSTLKSWNIKGNMLYFIYNFLSDREFVVRIANLFSDVHFLLNGVPQGAVLSPTLFIVGINGIAHSVPPLLLKAIFADDFYVAISCKDPEIGATLLQQAVDQIYQWTQNNGLKISQAKCRAIHFCKHYKCTKNLNIRINDIPIPVANSIKYLGVIFDNTSSWSLQIQNLKSKCFKKINLLKKLAHTSYGSDRFTLLKLYQTLIRPLIDYGSPLYGFASQHRLDSLNTIHNTCLRLITGAFRTTPIDSLLCESSEPPLNIRRHFISTRTILNILANPNPSSPLHFMIPPNSLPHNNDELLNSIYLKDINILYFPYNINPPWCTFNPNIDLSLTNLSKSQTNPIIYIRHYNNLINKYPNYVKIFTDGSKSPDRAGCAIIHENNEIPFSLPSHFTILSAELYALQLAINYSINLSSNNILILTDSLSALTSIQNFHKKKQHPISQTIVQTLSSIPKKIVFCWIPSHSGIRQNEKADEIAKLSLTFFPVPNTPIPLSDLKTISKCFISKSFQQHWNQVPDTNKLKPIKNSIDPWKTSHQQTRKDEVVLFRLRTGHSSLTHGYLLNKLPQPICETCTIPISIRHITIHCPKFQTQRNLHIPNETLESLLSDNDSKNLKLFSFLKATKLYPLI